MADETTEKLIMARCPRCHARLTYTKRLELDNWDCCPECGASLKVISTDPLKFQWEDRDYCDD